MNLDKGDDPAMPHNRTGKNLSATDTPQAPGVGESKVDGSPIQSPEHLKRLIKYGVCLWWADQPPLWVHPDDYEIAERFVPSNRVFRREECENASDRELGYSLLVYDPIQIRALPSIWMELPSEGLELNDFVEIRSHDGRLRPGVGTIRDMRWNRHKRVIEYYLTVNDQPDGRAYVAEELQPAIRLGSFLSPRELGISAKSRIA